MTSSIATSNQRLPPLRQTGEESKTQKHSANSTSTSIRKHPHQTPSYPVRIATDNMYPHRHAPYSRIEVKNVSASSGKDLARISQPSVSCNKSVTCNNKAARTSPNSAVEVRVLSPNALNSKVTTGCSVAGKELVYPAKENSQSFVNITIEKDKGRYEENPKRRKLRSKTTTSNKRAVSTNCTKERNCQSITTLDGRHDRYPASKNTPKCPSKIDASETLTGKVIVLTCPDKKTDLDSCEIGNKGRNARILLHEKVENSHLITVNEFEERREESCDDAQIQKAYDSMKNLSPENAISKDSAREVDSNQQGNPSYVECIEDAGVNATHAKRILVNSEEEGKEEKGLCKNASQPKKRPRKGKKHMDAELVYFDLETGGLYAGVDILQIAAVSNERSFMQYVTPTMPVHPKAQDVNGLKNENGTLMKRTSVEPLTWKPLKTLPVGKSLQNFLQWLKAIGPCFLAAHNAKFDKSHFLHHVCKSGLHKEFQKRVLGFVDTLPFFRKVLPEFKTRGLGYKQEVLVEHLLRERYDAHDALEDVKFLQKLVKQVNEPKPDLLKHKLPF